MLKPGDIIDIIAPSSYLNPASVKASLKILKDWGLKVRLPRQLTSKSGFHSNTDLKRTDFVKKAWASSSSACWALRGGYGAQKVQALLDKKVFKKKKLFIGFSDTTVLHLYLNTKYKHASLHGPHIQDISQLSKSDLAHLKSCLFGEKQDFTIKKLKVIYQGKAKKIRSRITGGNLSVIQSSIGTACLSSFKNQFLFLEDVNEPLYKIDRALYHLFYSGLLRGVKGLLFGSFHPIAEAQLKNQILKPFAKVSRIPIVMGIPSGHGARNISLPFNTGAELSFLNKNQAELKIKTF